MKVIKKYKGLFIVLGLLIVLLIVMALIFGRMFTKSGSDAYGNRLKGIVKISDKANKEVIDKIKEAAEVEDINIRIQGKIIYINIDYKHGTSISKAKEIADKIPSMYEEKITDDYDIEIFLVETPDDKEDTKEFVVVGTKHPLNEKISYTKS